MTNNRIKTDETIDIITLLEQTEFADIPALFDALSASLADYFSDIKNVAETLAFVGKTFQASEPSENMLLLEETQGKIIDYLIRDDLLKNLVAKEFRNIDYNSSPSFEKIMDELHHLSPVSIDGLKIKNKINNNINKVFSVLDQDDKIFLYREYCNPQKEYMNFSHVNEIMDIVFQNDTIFLDSIESIIDLELLFELLKREPTNIDERILQLKARLIQDDVNEFDDNFRRNNININYSHNNLVMPTKRNLLNEFYTASIPSEGQLPVESFEDIINSNGKRPSTPPGQTSNKKIKYTRISFFSTVVETGNEVALKSQIRFDFLKKLFKKGDEKLQFFSEIISFIAENLTNLDMGIKIDENTNRFGVLAISFSPDKRQNLPKIKIQFDRLLQEFQYISNNEKSIVDIKKELYKRYLTNKGQQNTNFPTSSISLFDFFEENKISENITSAWLSNNDLGNDRNDEIFESKNNNEIMDEQLNVELTEPTQHTDNNESLDDELKIKLYEQYFEKMLIMREHKGIASIPKRVTFSN